MEPAIQVLGHTLAELTAMLQPFDVRPFRARQLYRATYKRRVYEIESITDLPLVLREALKGYCCVSQTETDRVFHSLDGSSRYVFRLADDKKVESVWIPEPRRDTICVSTQVGCSLACGFCMTGVLGLARNLSPGEIVAQVGRVLNDQYGVGQDPPRGVNLVFMGMGEPLLNYDNVIKAIRLLCDPQGMSIPQRRLTLSTAGVVPRIHDLGKEPVRPELAISLSATTNALRDQLMPLNRRWPLEDLLAACRHYPLRRREWITFEYVMLDGINDSDDQADRLADLLIGLRAKVNLIPHNPAPGLPFRASSWRRILSFQARLNARQLPVFIRKPRGQDIDAACGQLAHRSPGFPLTKPRRTG